MGGGTRRENNFNNRTMSEQDWQPCGFVYTQAVSVPREKKKKKS